jgi:hypothetical protein
MVNDTPDPVGFGYNVTITANVTENTTGNYSGIKIVRINITYPDESSSEGGFQFCKIRHKNRLYNYLELQFYSLYCRYAVKK